MRKTRKGYKVYPLTVAQKFHFYYMDFCPKKEVLNIGTSLTIGVELDMEVLRQSIIEASERCECLRIRFFKDKDGTWYQYLTDEPEWNVEFEDFTDRSMEEAEAVLQSWTQVPFTGEEIPMSRIVMIKMPDGFQGVYFLVDHRIMDAQSMICFEKDIIEIYCNKVYEDVPYPKEMASYIA